MLQIKNVLCVILPINMRILYF